MMINFPMFDRLDISDYGLFPGAKDSELGLHIQFHPGLTLVLGANGLGKTTLIRIVFRLLTGPFDIPRLEGRRDLGTARLETTRLSSRERKTFADRVMDSARNARARLSFHLGSHSVVIERPLSNLALTRLEIDNQEIELKGEKTYQNKIIKLVGISSFGDWILLLRFLIFYFEDRRALVWDPSAQRQILRMLLLPASEARHWTKDERDILELDSRMRNLNAAVGREERALAESEAKVKMGDDIRNELEELAGLQETETELCERLENELLEVDSARRQARLRVLKSEQEREAQFRSIERIKLAAIGAQFPSRSETARYILAQLLTDQDCIVCGNHVPEVAADYAARVEHAQCVVCGSDITNSEVPSSADGDEFNSEVKQAIIDLGHIEANLVETRRTLKEAEADYQSHVAQIGKLRERINDRSRRIDLLVRQLPPEEAEMHRQRSQLALMRDRVEELKLQLASKRELFGEFIEEVNREIAKSKEAIKTSFDQYAEGFLLEQCQLTWAPQKAMVGQTGKSLMFPAFELDMAGADFPLPVRRSGPEQVSESQREFIDLAFRMALMSVATDGGSSLVMDAPESSLDAVFAPRAADVFSRFAEPTSDNRLIITSNLVEGQLIPSLIGFIPQKDRATRVVDLVEIAAPTAAVRERRSEYESILRRLLASPNAKDIDDGEEHKA
jgi:hypothetical protein